MGNAKCDVLVKAERDEATELLNRYVSSARLDMDQIRTCVEHPGFCSTKAMTVMLHDLQNASRHNNCNNNDNQEREHLMEKLVDQIENSKAYLNQIKEFAEKPESFTIEDVMNTMLQDDVMTTMIQDKLNHGNNLKYQERSDEFLVQI